MGVKHGLGNEVFPSFIVKYYNCTYTRKKNSVLDLKFKTTQPYHVHSISVKESLVCFVLFVLFLF